MNRLLIKNCVPAIIALTLTGLYSVIDGLFIGNAQGDNGLAAINIAWPVTALITAAGTGIGTGGSILYASFCGKKKQKAADSVLLQTQLLFFIAGIALLLVLGICKDGLLSLFGAKGIIFTLAEQYTKVILLGSLFQVVGAGVIPLLRSIGMAVSAMVVTIIGMIINMTANAIFLFVFHMGIRGTACGTVLAQSVVCVAGLFLIAKKTGVWIRCATVWQQSVYRIGRILSMGVASFGVAMSATIVFIFTNRQSLRYGGTKAVAVYAVISYLVFPVQSLLQGVGEGALPLMSFAYGKGDQKELRCIKRGAKFLLAGLSILVFVAAAFSIPVIGTWFGMSKTGCQLFVHGMKISALAFCMMGFVKFHIAEQSAIQNVKEAFLLTYGESLLLAPGLLFFLPIKLGLDGIWWSLPGTAAGMLLFYYLLQKGNQAKEMRNDCE